MLPFQKIYPNFRFSGKLLLFPFGIVTIKKNRRIPIKWGKFYEKAHGFRIFASFLALVFFLLSFSACAVKVKNSDFFLDYSLKQSAVFRDSDGNEIKPKFSGKDGDYIDITFSEPVNVNTLVLYEKGDNITAFEIFANRNGSFESIYKQDKVGEFRYCAFNRK